MHKSSVESSVWSSFSEDSKKSLTEGSKGEPHCFVFFFAEEHCSDFWAAELHCSDYRRFDGRLDFESKTLRLECEVVSLSELCSKSSEFSMNFISRNSSTWAVVRLLLRSFVDEWGGSSSPFERSISLSSLWPSISTAWKWQSISELEKICNIFRAVYLLRTARKRKRVLVVFIRCYIACPHLHNCSLQRVVYCICA